MDKSEGKDWFAKTLNNVTEETAKVYKISRLKLEINSFNKTYDVKIEDSHLGTDDNENIVDVKPETVENDEKKEDNK